MPYGKECLLYHNNLALVERDMPKIEFLESPKPVLVHRNYSVWGFLAGFVTGILVGHPLFMIMYVLHEYLYQQGPLDFTQAILHSFSFHAWPLSLLFGLSGALFGSLLGWVYSLLMESRLHEEYLRKEFELQVASLRHHYKNLAIGIKGLSNRIKEKLGKLDEVLEGICAKRRDCPGFQAYSQEFENIENHVVTLDSAARDLEATLAKELQLLRALASDCLILVPQDLYSVLTSSLRVLLGLRFQEKEIKVEINGRPWEECRETLPLQFEPYATEVVLQNILSNAMKYGNHIGVRVLDQAAEVRLEVEDNGPGFEVEKLKHRLLTTYADKKEESTHLGLGVSLYLLSKCGGRLGVSSELGRGTTFYMVLPK
ncbi:MAG: sensor histidine kinase [Syntrophobacterales bacterium]